MFSLVDKRADFSNPEVVGSNPGSVNFLYFFFNFFLKNTLRVFLVQILPHPLSPHFLNFVTIVQYLFAHCTIPSILGSHPHTPHHPLPPTLLPTNPLPIDQPHPIDPHHPRPDLTLHPPIFFLHFHNNFNSSFTSTLTPPTNPTPSQFVLKSISHGTEVNSYSFWSIRTQRFG